jgi:hypothetical protein
MRLKNLLSSYLSSVVLSLALIALVVSSSPISAVAMTGGNSNLEPLARLAVSANPAESAPALTALRNQGPAGLDMLFRVYASEIARHVTEPAATGATDPRWLRLTAALDAVSQQRDSYASGLYWYTDLEKAKAAARAEGKPILSLRLLGNLTEEFSCANSRFFRAILYPDPAVSALLREHFILHWKSVRPAPRVTIDFGDGRKLERTLTGNSIHYILDGDGRPLDAIPGLYGPKAFLSELARAENLFRLIASLTGRDKDAALRSYHLAAKRSTTSQWQADILRAGVIMNADDSIAEADGAPKSAQQAAPVAVNKAAIELKTVRLVADGNRVSVATPAPGDESTAWQKIAALHDGEVKLDARSIAVIRSQYHTLRPTHEALLRIINNLERNMAIDTVRNRYLLHSRIHQWFVDGVVKQDVDSLNERVYARLFLTPGSDPWLGLVTPDTFSGLVDDGVIGHQ